MTTKTFRPWELEQSWLFPPSVRDFVPDDHLAHFVRDVVRESLDLSEIYASYTEERGFPPYHPALITALLLYAYSQGVYSSRRIEKACVERLDFMAVTGMSRPDHATISRFRKRHRKALEGLFVQVLQLCREAGLVSLGHVALDGTKVDANASKHKAMSYARMKTDEPKLLAEVKRWLKQAQNDDDDDDHKHGGRRGDELPAWVASKQKRLEKIQEAKARLEQQAQEKARQILAERAERERELGHKLAPATLPRAASGVPEDKAQTNFTDPESRIMKTREGFRQAYNCQLAVNADSQVIVALSVTQKQNDVHELVPILEQIEGNLGELPRELSADSGYCSEANLTELEERGVSGYLATGRQKHGAASSTGHSQLERSPPVQRMRAKLQQGGHRSRYRLRKQTVEPVFGQIKEARGFRRFLTRGIESVTSEWSLLGAVHNLLKLAQAGGVRTALA